MLTETETNQVAGGDKGNHYGQKRDPGVPAWTVNDNGAFSPVGPSLARCWIRVIQMDDDPLHFIQMDDDPYTFGHQPHALLSRPDLATKHTSCRLPG